MTSRDHRIPEDNGEGRARPFLRGLTAIIGVFEWSGKIIAFSMLALTFVTLFANVVLRYAVGEGISWAYEIHALSLPWLVAGGMVVAAARSRNITITLLPDMLGPGMARVLLIAVNLAIVVIAANVLWSSQPILKASTFQSFSTETLANLGIKQVWGYTSLIYSFGSMTVISAINVFLVLLSPPPQKSDPAQTSLS